MKTILKYALIASFFLTTSILIAESGGGGVQIDPSCNAGGPGSATCAYSVKDGDVTIQCQVSCQAGYYACCGLNPEGNAVSCICKSSSSKTSSQSSS